MSTKKIVKFIISAILFIPQILLAQELGIKNALPGSASFFTDTWNYKVVSLDNQSITVSNIIIAFIALIIGIKLARYLSKSFKKKLFTIVDLDRNSANLISRVIDYTFLAIIVIVVLDIAKVPLTIFTFIGGAFLVSVGLSAQHLINNFISGIALIIEGKIRVGDMIEFEDIIGRVENIESRVVEVKTADNKYVFIPHSKLMQEIFSHWTYGRGVIRIDTSFKLEQQEITNEDFEEIVLNSVKQNNHILTNPEPQILLMEMVDNILRYDVRVWINLANTDRAIILNEVNKQIMSALKAQNISLAIPSMKHIELELHK